MARRQTELRRRQLDKQLTTLQGDFPARPQGGWLKAIRTALGLSLEVLGQRMGATKQAAHQLEALEARDSITLKKLRQAAEAMDCELVYALVPRSSLQGQIEERARTAARRIIGRVGHTMALENQAVNEEEDEYALNLLTRQLIELKDPRIWRD